MNPPLFMVLTACLLVISLADHRAGIGVHELVPSSTPAAYSAAARRTDTVLAAPGLLSAMRPQVSWLTRLRQPALDYHGLDSCESQPTAAWLASNARTDGILEAKAAAAAAAAPVVVARLDYHDLASCEAPHRKAPSAILMATAECALNDQMCAPGDPGRDAFVAGWVLRVDAHPLRLPRSEADDTILAAIDERLAAVAAARASAHGLGFDPLSEPQFVAIAAAPAPGAAFEAFLARDENIHGPDHTREISHRIRPGETISEVLDQAGIMPGEVSRWVSAANEVYDLDRIYAGQALSMSVDVASSTLQELALEIDRRNVLVAQRGDGDGVVVKREKIPYLVSQRVVESKISSSLYMAAVSEGIPDRVVSAMAEILGWEIDFARDIRPGASFRLVYEELRRADGRGTTAGRVLALEVENRGNRHEGFFFPSATGNGGGYYNRKGEALGGYFLRYPVEFTRISSRFSERRFHPVLKRNKPHYGVDFAAPTGTPVKAIAGGKIIKAGWHGGNGRFVKLQHDSVYESGYAHLSRIAEGVEPGSFVRQGQIIGYVGSTGLATGPHLHMALYRRGKYIDPLSAELPRAEPLTGSALASFHRAVDEIERSFARAAGNDGRLAGVTSNARPD